MQPVDALPSEVLERVFAFLCHDALLTAECVCRAFRGTILTSDLWQARVRTAVVVSDEDAPAHPLGWKQLACVCAQPRDDKTQLLDDIACSTVHRPVETPSNTLTPSLCWISVSSLPPDADPARSYIQRGAWHRSLGYLAQLECGCRGQACYWSSTSSRDKNAVDFIDYSVQSRSLVRALEVVPYRAFWHPHSPTYGPAAVSISIYFRAKLQTLNDKQHGALLYQSPVFPLENAMKLQELRLPLPVWLPNGAILRLNLLGRHQTEPFELRGMVPDNEGDYYTAISYVAARGVHSPQTPP